MNEIYCSNLSQSRSNVPMLICLIGLGVPLTSYGLYRLLKAYHLHQKLYHSPVCQRIGLKLANYGIDSLLKIQTLIPSVKITWPVSMPKPEEDNRHLIIRNIQIRLVQDRQTVSKLNIDSMSRLEPYDLNLSTRLLIDLNYQIQGRDYLITWNAGQTNAGQTGNQRINLWQYVNVSSTPWMNWTKVSIRFDQNSTLSEESKSKMEGEILLKMNQYLGPKTDFHSGLTRLHFDDLNLPNLSDIVSLELESNLGEKLTIQSNIDLDMGRLVD